jgi:hypothetical protein
MNTICIPVNINKYSNADCSAPLLKLTKYILYSRSISALVKRCWKCDRKVLCGARESLLSCARSCAHTSSILPRTSLRGSESAPACVNNIMDGWMCVWMTNVQQQLRRLPSRLHPMLTAIGHLCVPRHLIHVHRRYHCLSLVTFQMIASNLSELR